MVVEFVDPLNRGISAIGSALGGSESVGEKERRLQCRAEGGRWNPETKTCDFSQRDAKEGERLKQEKEQETAQIDQTRQEEQVKQQLQDQKLLESGQSFITDKEGNRILTSEQNITQERADLLRTQEGRLTDEQVIQQQQAQAQNATLAQQAGQFNPLTVNPSDIDQTEMLAQSLASAVPRALSLAAGGATAGFVGGGSITGGLGAVPSALIGGVAGFVGGISSALIRNYRDQRTDTVNAQKRVLDEGKQVLNDWVTLARTDPSNRRLYLENFNKQLALVDQAYRQMKLDTQRDPLKFETAVRDLAEFEAFYNLEGERDFLVTEMRFALQSPSTPEYDMLEMANRRL